MPVQYDVPLAPLTTLRIGGLAARLVEATSDHQIREVVEDTRVHGEPLLVLGGGSNLLVPDEGWPGTVLRIAVPGIQIEPHGAHVLLRVGAGEEWDALVARCVDEGFSGLECLSGIPGLAGSTPIQNVGAYGCEVGDCLVSVHVLDRGTGSFSELSREACELSYRHSMFKQQPGRYVLTALTLRLHVRSESVPIRYAELAKALGVQEGASAPLRQVRDTVVSLRRSKGMVVDDADPESRSAGSWFTNPILDASARELLEQRVRSMPDLPAPPVFAAGEGKFKVAAAWLIERAGFSKGHTRDGAGISRKHALSLVNRGATSCAMLSLEAEIVEGVRSKFGVTLSREPVLATP